MKISMLQTNTVLSFWPDFHRSMTLPGSALFIHPVYFPFKLRHWVYQFSSDFHPFHLQMKDANSFNNYLSIIPQVKRAGKLSSTYSKYEMIGHLQILAFSIDDVYFFFKFRMVMNEPCLGGPLGVWASLCWYFRLILMSELESSWNFLS